MEYQAWQEFNNHKYCSLGAENNYCKIKINITKKQPKLLHKEDGM